MQQMTVFDFLTPCKKPATSKETAETRRESHRKTNKENMYSNVLKVLDKDILTAREIAQRLFKMGVIEYPARAIIQPRITELVENGVLRVAGKKFDSQSRRNVAQYRKENENERTKTKPQQNG